MNAGVAKKLVNERGERRVLVESEVRSTPLTAGTTD